MHFDSEDDHCTGCRNVSHCQQQQSYSGLRSPGRSCILNLWYCRLFTVVVQFYRSYYFDIPLFWCKVMYSNGFQTKENKIETKDKIEPQHLHYLWKSSKQALSHYSLVKIHFSLANGNISASFKRKMVKNHGFCSFTNNKQTCEWSCQRFRPG